MKVQHFFDFHTYTLTYIVYDEHTKDAVIIDTVLDYNQASSTFYEQQIDTYTNFIKENGLKLHYILETHAHADHISGSAYLKKRFPEALVGIGVNIKTVQRTFKEVYNLETLPVNGSQFDILFKNEETLNAGSLNFKIIETPGHTPACVSYFFDNKILFTGDALFIEDFGTGRCDFPDGSAKQMYDSVFNKIYTLNEDVKIFPGHDYQPGGRELRYESNVGIQKRENIQLTQKTSEDEYIKFRTKRDEKLNTPKLLLPSIQINIAAGKLPESDNNEISYLKIPITRKTDG